MTFYSLAASNPEACAAQRRLLFVCSRPGKGEKGSPRHLLIALGCQGFDPVEVGPGSQVKCLAVRGG